MKTGPTTWYQGDCCIAMASTIGGIPNVTSAQTLAIVAGAMTQRGVRVWVGNSAISQ